VEYESDAIMYVGEAGLEYVDEYGDRRFINFEACWQNAAAHVQNTDAQGCVARGMLRITHSGSIQHTMEFFTRRPTVFVLESEQAFRRLRFRIEQMGWRVW
jgi:hypothetical protein